MDLLQPRKKIEEALGRASCWPVGQLASSRATSGSQAGVLMLKLKKDKRARSEQEATSKQQSASQGSQLNRRRRERGTRVESEQSFLEQRLSQEEEKKRQRARRRASLSKRTYFPPSYFHVSWCTSSSCSRFFLFEVVSAPFPPFCRHTSCCSADPSRRL